ncbi:uncharacterized protein BBA_09444 [Beauveria bassiana ARSEF 2860]|uniref:Uncharacterized protein n=1 Tax=Beauveria bassiana (strain ARSEF 2860) TaxID=655819 RepID=J5JCK9_BEAB2|nr:uncharacterized protein BBA_09444 [Beauveria bassiana ARSEF 2860]EJP61601.1 hypothetical protein BBA_09444 [Beauveria bassiana ARSEF 2860]
MPVTRSRTSAPLSGTAIPSQKTFNSEVIDIYSSDESASNNTSASSKPCADPLIKTREPAETAIGPRLRDFGHCKDVDSTRYYENAGGEPAGEGDSGSGGLDSVAGIDQPLAHIRRRSFPGQTNGEISRQRLDDEIPDSEEDSDDGKLRADANTDTETNRASELTTEGKRDGPRGRIAVGNIPHNKRKASIEPSEQKCAYYGGQTKTTTV